MDALLQLRDTYTKFAGPVTQTKDNGVSAYYHDGQQGCPMIGTFNIPSS